MNDLLIGYPYHLTRASSSLTLPKLLHLPCTETLAVSLEVRTGPCLSLCPPSTPNCILIISAPDGQITVFNFAAQPSAQSLGISASAARGWETAMPHNAGTWGQYPTHGGRAQAGQSEKRKRGEDLISISISKGDTEKLPTSWAQQQTALLKTT